MAGQSRKPTRRKTTRTRSASASRAELNQLLRVILDQAGVIERVRDEQAVQFRRMAQLQAELDSIKQSLDRVRNGNGA